MIWKEKATNQATSTKTVDLNEEETIYQTERERININSNGGTVLGKKKNKKGVKM